MSYFGSPEFADDLKRAGAQKKRAEHQPQPPLTDEDIAREIAAMGRRNAHAMYRASRVPHPWDEWDIEPEVVAAGSNGLADPDDEH
jgi:acyl dehydratase